MQHCTCTWVWGSRGSGSIPLSVAPVDVRPEGRMGGEGNLESDVEICGDLFRLLDSSCMMRKETRCICSTEPEEPSISLSLLN